MGFPQTEEFFFGGVGWNGVGEMKDGLAASNLRRKAFGSCKHCLYISGFRWLRPQTSNGAPPLDLAGGLLSPRPRVPTLQHADVPPPQSATLGLHPVARKLLLISRPAELT